MKTLLQRLFAPLRALFGGLARTGSSGYLCDRCRWDYGDACRRSERPNARICPDFKAR